MGKVTTAKLRMFERKTAAFARQSDALAVAAGELKKDAEEFALAIKHMVEKSNER